MCHYVSKSSLTGCKQCDACLASQFTKQTDSALKISICFENRNKSVLVSNLTTSYLKTEVQSTSEIYCKYELPQAVNIVNITMVT
jgi:hypothetical protein